MLLQYSLELCCLFTLLMCAVDALGCAQGVSLALPPLFCTGHITSRRAYSQLTDLQPTLQWLFFEGKAIRFAPLTKLLAHRPQGKQRDGSSGPGRERTSKPRGWGLTEQSRLAWILWGQGEQWGPGPGHITSPPPGKGKNPSGSLLECVCKPQGCAQ